MSIAYLDFKRRAFFAFIRELFCRHEMGEPHSETQHFELATRMLVFGECKKCGMMGCVFVEVPPRERYAITETLRTFFLSRARDWWRIA